MDGYFWSSILPAAYTTETEFLRNIQDEARLYRSSYRQMNTNVDPWNELRLRDNIVRQELLHEGLEMLETYDNATFLLGLTAVAGHVATSTTSRLVRVNTGDVVEDVIAYRLRRVNTDGLDGISRTQLRDFGASIADNPRAASLYEQLSNHSIDVNLDFCPIVRNPNGTVAAGYSSRFQPVTINARAHNSIDGMLGTFGHESRHALDRIRGLPLGNRWSEYRAFLEEFIVRNGRAPNRSEMARLAADVNDIYQHIYPPDLRLERIVEY